MSLPVDPYLEAKDRLNRAIYLIDKRVRQYRQGNIDGFTIDKNEVMRQARAIKTELLSAWNNYKTELQAIVN